MLVPILRTIPLLLLTKPPHYRPTSVCLLVGLCFSKTNQNSYGQTFITFWSSRTWDK